MKDRKHGQQQPLRRLAVISGYAASYPIEIIVLFFIIVTLCYFQLLQAVKDSDFLNADLPPLIPFPTSTSPLILRRIGQKWIGVGDGSSTPADTLLHLQPIIVSLDPLPVKSSNKNHSLDSQPAVLSAIDGLDMHLRSEMTVFEQASLRFDPDLCFRTKQRECFVANFHDGDAAFASPRSTVLTYGFAQGTDDAQKEWLRKLPAQLSTFSSKATFTALDAHGPPLPLSSDPSGSLNRSASSSRGLGISLPLSPGPLDSSTHYEPSLRQIKNFSWVFYAFKAFTLRFWDLAKKADSADFCIMLVTYILMHATFVNLFLNMRKLGSKFVLACSVLVSSVFGFIVTLFMAYLLRMTVNPVTLSEALPFMVVVIGFDKPFVLARAVFRHPAINGSEPSSGLNRIDYFNYFSHSDRRSANAPFGSDEPSSNRSIEPKTAKQIVFAAVNRHGFQIVRDYAIEIAVLLVGAMSQVPGLMEFCQLGALILIFDCLFLFVFYVAILTVMVEVHRIKLLRSVRRVDSTTDLAKMLDDGTNSPHTEYSSLTYKQSMVKLLTGRVPGEPSQRSRAANLKLLLLAAFVGLHVLNMTTTLSTKTAILRHHSPTSSVKVEAASTFLVSALDKLSSSHSPDVNLLVKVSPPALVHLFWSGLSSPLGAPRPVDSADTVFSAFDRFMTAWSTVVGDPVMSKWIIIALALSVFLNGYLLRGVSIGSSRAVAAESAARILLASTGQLDLDEEKPGKLLRRHSESSENMLGVRASYARRASTKSNDLPAVEEPPSWNPSDGEKSAPDSPLKMLKHPRPRRPTEGSTVVDRLEVKQDPRPPTIRIPTPSISDASSYSDLAPSTPATTVEDDGPITPRQPRLLEECIAVFAGGEGALQLVDEEIILLVQKGKIAAYALEKLLKDHQRAVRIRRALISRASTTKTLETSLLPFMHYDYSKVMGQCCENVIGYVPLPCGIAGPLRVDGTALPIPMATAEGALVASTSRGCKALNAGGGVTTVITKDGMTRGPCLEFKTLKEAGQALAWIESEDGSNTLKAAFNTTSSFARLQTLKCALAGRSLFVRFTTQTGDAMGMNMISKGTERALETMLENFPGMRIISLSGNYCTDKKPAAINWIEGRGKSVVAEGIIPGTIVKSILKTTVADLVKLNISKNLIGSAMAGSVGGFNAHAANILTAIYLATGQDPAQNVESSNCMTLMEAINGGEDLLITCTMPSIEVGTIGGGTILGPQRAMLEMLGVAGPHPTRPGANAQQLARIICAAVMAGELSLMSALASGHLVESHLALNRSAPATPATLKATNHTWLTPAPTRPSTPGANGQKSHTLRASSSFTPLASSSNVSTPNALHFGG